MTQNLQDKIMEEINCSEGIDSFISNLSTFTRLSNWNQNLKDRIPNSLVFFRSLYDIEEVDVESVAKRIEDSLISFIDLLKDETDHCDQSLLLIRILDDIWIRISPLRKVS